MWLTRHHPELRTAKRPLSEKAGKPARTATVTPAPARPPIVRGVELSEADLIRVGQAKKPREDGWIRLKMHTDHPERFDVGSELLAEIEPGRGVPVKVIDSRDSGPADEVEIRIAEIPTGTPCVVHPSGRLFIEKQQRKPAPRGTFYPDELEGMTVEDCKGELVGTVVHLEADVPAPYLVVKSDQYGELLIPYHRQVLREVSREKRRVKLVGTAAEQVPES
ncbi:MAG TPA: hypothetical protein PKO06_00990 [Candidatus Ozemobacteraceae bacterium]|nr:hypothetical protein [Candidatus Ozemobacteraceae bacterium]